jgi:protein ImuB
MPVAEALAVEPRLHRIEDAPAEDLRVLENLAEWATRFSPFVGLEDGPRPQSLLLDVTGCGAYFGGEDKLLERASHDWKAEGWVARIAIADTVGAAWALAHYGRTPRLAGPGGTERVLKPLSIAALRLPLDALHLLERLGVERVAQLIALPRESLPTRFGPLVILRLDQALGRLPEVIVPHHPQPDVQECFPLEYPTDRLDTLWMILDQLVERLQEALAKRHLGARRVECVFRHEAASPTRIEVSLSRPSRSSQHLRLLLRTRLEDVQLEGPVSELSLRVSAAERLVDVQEDLLEMEQRPDREGLTHLIDHLSNRLGREAVTRARLVPDPQPEYACRFDPLVQETESLWQKWGLAPRNSEPGPIFATGSEKTRPRGRRRKDDASSTVAGGRFAFVRPLQLWPVPEPIQVLSVVPDGPPLRIGWGGTEYRVIRSWGPERIETGWWRGEDVRRDYYVTATDRGNRFWVFRRTEDGCWFLHGSFD